MPLRATGRLRLQITLIHNHDPQRNAYLIPHLAALAKAFVASFTQISWQPSRQPHSRWIRLYRDWQLYKLNFAWARYRGLGLSAALRLTRSNARYILGPFNPSDAERRRRQISQIETIVTSKHILAWQTFLESDASHLLVCEDDLVIKPDSQQRLAALLAGMEASSALFYADVAGGLDRAELVADKLLARREGDQLHYVPAVTNTACGYLLSRPLAAHFLAILLRRPELRLVCIDWLMNALLIELNARGITCTGIHQEPPIFAHGSFSGDYVSWLAAARKGDLAASKL